MNHATLFDLTSRKTHTIHTDYSEMGRDASCNLHFPEGQQYSMVSRRHTAIKRVDDCWYIVHLSNTNPTLVNGIPLSVPNQEMEIYDGDIIRLSNHGPELKFTISKVEEAAPEMDTATSIEAPTTEPPQTHRSRKWLWLLLPVLAVAAIAWGVISLKPEKEQPKDINAQLADCMAEVYHIKPIKMSFTFRGETETVDLEGIRWSGTGFCTSDGRFITARHVVEPWLTGDSEDMFWFNIVASSGGTVRVTYEAISPSHSFQFSLDDCHRNTSGDSVVSRRTLYGAKYQDVIPSGTTYDYAWLNRENESTMAVDTTKAQSVHMGEKLYILGYPYGLKGDQDKPLFSHAEAATSGLTDGVIVTTDTGFEHGNSGGPVMCEVDGVLKVVGIVTAGIGNSTGIVIPITLIQ